MENLLVVSHSKDMDGITSGLIAQAYFMDINMENMYASFDYYDNETIFKTLLSDPKKVYSGIVFIDVTPSIEWFKSWQSDQNKLPIVIIDHHFAKLNEISEALFDVKIGASSDDLSVAVCDKLSFIYSSNSATKTLEMLIEDKAVCDLIGLEMKDYIVIPNDKWLINFVDFYDVWKWEKAVINEYKTINPIGQYSLYDIASDILYDNSDIYPTDLVTSVDTYMFNYSLNKTFKKTRGIDMDLLSKIGLNLDYLKEYMVDFDSNYTTVLFRKLISNEFIDVDKTTFNNNMLHWINEGYNEYISDYQEVADFIENHPDIDSIIEEVSYKGFDYLIVNYKFSNIIRDYFFNNYSGIDFVLFPRFEDTVFKVTGRTLKQGAFDVGKLLKDVYNGGGHRDAGGGTIDKNKVDINTLSHSKLVNEFIDKLS